MLFFMPILETSAKQHLSASETTAQHRNHAQPIEPVRTSTSTRPSTTKHDPFLKSPAKTTKTTPFAKKASPTVDDPRSDLTRR
jgi:hypothetical protein